MRDLTRFLSVGVVLAASVALAGCAPSVAKPGAVKHGAAGEHPFVDVNQLPPITAYRIKPGDQIRVKMVELPEMTEDGAVQADGQYFLLKAGNIRLAGLTFPEADQAVAKAYEGYLNHPDITVSLLIPGKNVVMVAGDVGKPKPVYAPAGITLSQLILAAGGLLPTADGSHISVLRSEGGPAALYKADFAAIMSGEHPEQDVRLFPGDVVFVPKSAIGEVDDQVATFIGLTDELRIYYLPYTGNRANAAARAQSFPVATPAAAAPAAAATTLP